MFGSIDTIEKIINQFKTNMANNYQTPPPPTATDAVTKEKIANILKQGFQFGTISGENQDGAIEFLSDRLWNYLKENSNSQLKERLNIYWEFEKHYLDVLKEYKEELKFVASMQEDLRKERAKFFGETLKVVSNTLKETQVSADIQSRWIAELVSSYTQSLDLSDNLIQEKTAQSLENIKKEVEQTVKNSQE